MDVDTSSRPPKTAARLTVQAWNDISTRETAIAVLAKKGATPSLEVGKAKVDMLGKSTGGLHTWKRLRMNARLGIHHPSPWTLVLASVPGGLR
jgi:hypothetical protein